jgi:hypothetical protein
MVQIGDKVRFLDAVGGGRVTAFRGKDTAMVEDEDGFEIPCLISQLVVVSDEADERARGHVHAKQAPPRSLPDSAMRGSQEFSDTKKAPEPVKAEEPATAVPVTPKWSELPVEKGHAPLKEDAAGDTLSVSLAFLPVDLKHLSESDFECFLVNDSNYQLTYLLLSNSDKGKTAQTFKLAGSIEANTKMRLFTVAHSELEELEHLALQLLAYKPAKTFKLQSPMHIDIRLNADRFWKLHAFTENDYFDTPALLQAVVRDGRPWLPMVLDEKRIAEGIREKTRDVKANRPAAAEHLQTPAKPAKPWPQVEPMEVDLHIDALIDSTAGMDAASILQYQLSVFHKTMNAHIHELGRRIVFIHGKGEGVLRKELLAELRRFYPACTANDASYQNYGGGATMVTIHQGK